MAPGPSQQYFIRNYSRKDASKIGRFSKILELSYLYNRDFAKENIFCAVDDKKDILGVAHLEPDPSWHLIGRNIKPPSFKYKLRMNICIKPGLDICKRLKERLLEVLIDKGQSIAKRYPDKKVQLINYFSCEEHEDMDIYFSQGFFAARSHYIMKRYLNETIIDDTECPNGIEIYKWCLNTRKEQMRYLEAQAGGFDGLAWSRSLLKWYARIPEFEVFAAFAGNEAVGSAMTWEISTDSSATENIFVLPQWRDKGVGRTLTTTLLKYLRDNGKKVASLSVFGDNQPALKLYESLGYRVSGINIELARDL